MIVNYILAAFNSSVTLSKNFTSELANTSSPEFKAEADSFCAGVNASYQNSNISDAYQGCVVTGFE